MSVLIKGMKMPEKCGLCDLFHAESPMHCTVVKGHKTVGAPYGMPRPDWCPLVEVKHGKWIQLMEYDIDENAVFQCSVCGGSDMHAKGVDVPYCWHCGARMDKE